MVICHLRLFSTFFISYVLRRLSLPGLGKDIPPVQGFSRLDRPQTVRQGELLCRRDD
jgi:hypothetical protein